MTYRLKKCLNMTPKEFRQLARQNEWNTFTMEVCKGYIQANLVILPQEYAYDFLLFCQRNPCPCPILDVTEPGNPHPLLIAPEADLRTDLPKYRIFRKGKLVEEPLDIKSYWQGNLVGFILGSSRSFEWSFLAANLSWCNYQAYSTNISCKPAGRFHGHMVVTVRSFPKTADAIRAIQISSRHVLNHGTPIYIGDPKTIGIKQLGKPDPIFPNRPELPAPGKDEIVMSWGCGITAQKIALECKIPLMITHSPGCMFISDQLAEEMAIM